MSAGHVPSFSLRTERFVQPESNQTSRMSDSLRHFAEPLAAGVAIENDQRHAPKALSRNAPVGTLGDHFVQTAFAPLRLPFHFFDFAERVQAKIVAIESDEPLLGSAKDHGIVAGPEVGIAGGDICLPPRHPR